MLVRVAVYLVVACLVAGAATASANVRPRITESILTQEGHGPGGPSYYVTVTARLRVCDDAGGALTVLVREQLLIGKLEEAERRFTRRLALARPGCARYTVRWRVGDQFFGVGWYVVNLRLRDAGGLASKPVGQAWLTRD
jgi:hypothetical protein